MSYYPIDGFYSSHPNYYAKSFCEEMAWWNWRDDGASAFTALPSFPTYRYGDYCSQNYGFPFGTDGYICPLYPPAQSYPSPSSSLPSIPEEKIQEEDDEVTEAAVQLLKKKEKEAVKKGRPTKNPVWSLFRRVNGKSVMCSLCYKIVKSACATNMSKHLGRHHSEYTTTTVTQPRKEEPSEYKPYSYYTVIKRQRKTKHPVWTFFKRGEYGNAHCRLCHSVVRSPCSSNFMGHLQRHHQPEHAEVYKIWFENRSKKDTGKELGSVTPPVELECPEDDENPRQDDSDVGIPSLQEFSFSKLS